MTPAQKRAIARAFEGAVAFPPMWDKEDGMVVAMVPMSFAGRHGEFPDNIDFELIRVAPDGEELERWEARYHLDP